MSRCPSWCVADHARDDRPGAVCHRGAVQVVPVALDGRSGEGVRAGELLVEVSRRYGEAATWVYLGDGWTGFSLSIESATRLSGALTTALRATGTLDPTGL